MDGSIGGIAEVLFQLLGEELSFNIRGKSKIPRRFFLFCDLSQGQGVISTILAAQSTDVDTISGATFSSTGIINAVNDALGKAENQ